MKILLALFLFLSTTLSFAQWNSETGLFSVSSGTKLSSSVDQNGTHIVYYNSGSIKYAYVNGSGTLVRYNVTIESSSSDLANIVSDGNSLYTIYSKNNYLTISKSTNLGASWSSYSLYEFKNTGCNEIKSKMDGDFIHVTWSELRSGSYNNYDVHYVRFRHSDREWDQYQRVTDVELYYGGDLPAIDLNSTKIYVSYRTSNSQAIHVRTKDLSTGNWNTPENIPIYQNFLDELDESLITTPVKFNDLFVSNDRINSISKIDWNGFDHSGSYVSHGYKLNSGGTWQLGDSFNSEQDYPNSYKIVTAKTSNLLHVIYWDEYLSLFTHRSISGSSWSNPIDYIGLGNNSFLNSQGNDLYLIKASSTSIISRKYEQVPLTPASFTISNSGNPNYHPVLSWSRATEPDVYANSNGIRLERRLWNINTESWTAWSETSLNGTTSSFTDTEILNATGAGFGKAQYRVRNVDLSNNYSSYSNTLQVVYGVSANKSGLDFEAPLKFDLIQNFPNPFNPSTKINFSLPNAAGVSLKLYNIAGAEVAVIINETMEAGNHSVIVNIAEYNLTSGIYFYKLTAGEFSKTMKMTILK